MMVQFSRKMFIFAIAIPTNDQITYNNTTNSSVVYELWSARWDCTGV